MNELEQEIARLTKENEALRKQIKPKVNGWTITNKIVSDGRKKYEKMYACRRIAGKLHWVYLGANANDVENKIAAYMLRVINKLQNYNIIEQ